MKKVILSLILACAGFSALADVQYNGRCTVLSQAPDLKLLANVQVALTPGKTVTVYKQGNIIYEVSMLANPGSSPVTYTVQTTITYGDPNFLGQGQLNISEPELMSAQSLGVGVSLPDFPTFGCGRP